MTNVVETTQTFAHQQAVTRLKGVGKQLALRLEKLGILSLQDLLLHLPYRYVDRTRITPLGQLHPGQSAVIQGQIRSTNVVYGKRRSLVCRVQDTSGSINLRFYHFSASQKNVFVQGHTIRCFGDVRPGSSGLEMYHPEYQLFSDTIGPLEQTLTPAYHTTDGITQPRLRQLIKQAFGLVQSGMLPNLAPPAGSLSHPRLGDKSLLEKLHFLHFPPSNINTDELIEGEHRYQQELIIEELTAYQLSLLRLREQRLTQQGIDLSHPSKSYQVAFIQSLPYTLTGAQQRVGKEISDDLIKSTPMMRLLQGDVGSGKTIVAAMAALIAISADKQVALMAPTDILTEQHRACFEGWFAPLGIKVVSLSGKQKVGLRRQQLAAIGDGSAQMVVGTHALFQESVSFNRLALVIIDEQHRFGVQQRMGLRDKGINHAGIPHQLIMTATPIPRTLAMSAYADLDYSVIDELPKGRQGIETVAISQKRRPEIIERIRYACMQQRQAYWVCTLIEQSETLSAEAAEDTAVSLQQQLPELRVGLIHGRLKALEKETIMAEFKAGKINLLVATTVIEVGVDVANASLMVIENPERLGLAQLHQLRGRVGRGPIASHCVLLYGDALSHNGKERLQAMRATNDGFKIAEIDLKLRGPGEVLGTRQTGDINFKLADLQRDQHLLASIHEQAKGLINTHPILCAQLIQRWVGLSEQFAQA